ncbi:MAG: hypothetical protein ACO20I_15135 [bacterium]
MSLWFFLPLPTFATCNNPDLRDRTPPASQPPHNATQPPMNNTQIENRNG